MVANPELAYWATELDPELLSTPFVVQTAWHVIAGAPCCGKTTLVEMLAGRGYRTVPEIARSYIERETARGRIHPVRARPTDFQRKLARLQLRVEGGLPAEELLFLDGAVPSSLAWYRAFGVNPSELLKDCFHHHYASVFMLEPLPFSTDGERVREMAGIVGYLTEWQTRDYSSLGYRVVRVPVLPPEERAAYVLERLSA